MVLFERGEVSSQVTTEGAIRKFRQRVECGLLTTCDEIHKLTRVYRLRTPEDDLQTSLTGGSLPNSTP